VRKNRPRYLIILIIALFAFCFGPDLQAQDQKEKAIVQLSGLVMNADSTLYIPRANIYNPETGRGIATNYVGWFSKPFYAGDTLVVSVIGYKNIEYVVPEDQGDRVTVVFALEEEITTLEDVEISPFPTEEIFKEAILAMNLTEEQEQVLNAFQPETIQEMVRTMSVEGSPGMNYRYMMNQQFYQLQQQAGPATNPLLNPFAWANFINSLKKKKK